MIKWQTNKVSIAVIMSLYREDKLEYVKLAVESLLNQTYQAFNLYIKFDGVIEIETEAYLRSLEDCRIMISARSENKGLAHSLNELLQEVKVLGYDFIARMDADDISLPDRFQRQIDFLNMNPQIDAVGGAINEIDELGNDRGKITRYPCKPDECKKFFARRNPVAHPTVMFRKSFFEKVGWEYPTDFARNEDTRLWHEGYKHGCSIANISDVLLDFRMTDKMFTQRRNGREFAKSQLELRKLIAKDLGYGNKAIFYAYAMYILMISPSWLLKFAYKVLR